MEKINEIFSRNVNEENEIENNETNRLKKNKYTVIFDLETTGLDTNKDRIIQIAMIKVDSITFDIVKQFECKIYPSNGEKSSDDAIKIHKIKNEDLIGCPMFIDIADYVLDFIKDCDLSGFNIANFDIPILTREFHLAGKKVFFGNRRLVDVYLISNEYIKKDQVHIYRVLYDKNGVGYHLPGYRKELVEHAHDALVDITMTREIYLGLIKQFNITDEIIDELNGNYTYRIDFGGLFIKKNNGFNNIYIDKWAHKGETWMEVTLNYCGYLYNECRLAYDSKHIVARIFKKRTKLDIPTGPNWKKDLKSMAKQHNLSIYK